MYTAEEKIVYYKSCLSMIPGSLQEVCRQYTDMARGGNGGELYGVGEKDADGCYPTCREYNYPSQPDSFFREVCEGMGWAWYYEDEVS